MKKGYYYYMLLTPEERERLKNEFLCYDLKEQLKLKYHSFYHFISESCDYNMYWSKVAASERSHRPKKKQKEKPKRYNVQFIGRGCGKVLSLNNVKCEIL